MVGGGDDGPSLDAETRVKGRLTQWCPPDTAPGKHSHPQSLGSSPGEPDRGLQRFGQLYELRSHECKNQRGKSALHPIWRIRNLAGEIKNHLIQTNIEE